MRKISLSVLLSIMFICLLLLNNTYACVGKTIIIGSKDTSTVQRLIDEILALLINERTGTSVKLMQFDSAEKCRAAIISSEVDIYVEYTGSAMTEVLKVSELKEKDAVFNLVKNEYNEKYNLIWLAPYGFDYPDGLKSEFKDKGIPSIAAPIIRKDTLKKFPALARLLTKLTGKISNEELSVLVKSVAGDNYKEIARKFLKENKLI